MRQYHEPKPRKAAAVHPFWKIFLSIACYIAAVVGLGLAVINASQKPPATTAAIIYGVAGVIFGIGGIMLTRKPRY
jgi:hypothetical protein